jgi:hypothetical protein
VLCFIDLLGARKSTYSIIKTSKKELSWIDVVPIGTFLMISKAN